MTRVKLCGITNARDRDAAIAAGADALGFIVDVGVDTPREIGVERAAELIDGVPPFVSTVLVTMPDDPNHARVTLDRTGADVVQVHGDSDPKDVTTLSTPGIDVVRAVDGDDPDAAREFDGVADAILVDSTDAAGGGGTGRTHDWAATRELRERLETPVILAGGLSPENVGEAVRTVEPFAVDVASGVEAEGGVKDHDALQAFVGNATRAARNETAAREGEVSQ